MGREIKRLRVAGFPLMMSIIERMDLKTILGKYLGSHGNEKISTVDSLIIILLNIMTGRDPLYELPQWASSIHPQCFNLSEEDKNVINDDRAGRALSKIYHADRATIMTEIVVKTVEEFKIKLDQVANDSTSLKTYSKSKKKTKTGLEYKKGKSKDHRPDLNQILYTLTISADGAVPVHYKTYPGNKTDDKTHIETWDMLVEIFKKSDFLYTADCKVCTKEQLRHIVGNGGRVVTVMPETWGEVKIFKDECREKNKRKKEVIRHKQSGTVGSECEYYSEIAGKYFSKEDGYRIHWIYSSEKRKYDLKSREKRLAKAEGELEDLLIKINMRNLKTKEAVEERCVKILKKYKFSQFIDFLVKTRKVTTKKQIGRGRPSKKTKYKDITSTELSLRWTVKKSALVKEKRVDGLFPILSTDEKLIAKEALAAYKYQPRLEKRFNHLKEVLNGAPFYFKSIERLEGVMFMYFIGLMVLSLIEREVRNGMKDNKIEQLFIYPEDRPSTTPTTSIILDRFEDVSVCYLMDKGAVIEKFADNLNDTQMEILELLNIDLKRYWPTVL